MGNIHVAPVSRLWKTNKLEKLTEQITTADSQQKNVFTQYRRRGSSSAPPTKGQIPFQKPLKMDYISVCQMAYDSSEKAEAKIAKQALLEALF